MAPLVFVEVLGRHDQVLHRLGIDQLPCTIGRGYGNDVILGDPFVHARHARLEAIEGGGLQLLDLVTKSATLVDEAKGSTITVGRTRVRLRTPRFQVPPAKQDPLFDSRLGAFARNRKMLAGCLVWGYVALLASIHFGNHSSELTDGVGQVVAGVFFLLVWASMWSLMGRIRSSRKSFLAHLSLSTVAMSLTLAVELLVGFGHSVAPASAVYWPAKLLANAVILAVLVATQCLVIGVPSFRRAAQVGGTCAAILMATVFLTRVAAEARFSDGLEITAVVQPLPTALILTQSPSDFLEDFDAVRSKLHADLKEP